TDAKVSPVNYGGPLVDVEGRVMGILVPLSPMATGEVAGAEWYDSGIGFAIPLVDVHAALDRLKGGNDLFAGLMGVTIKGQDLYEKDVLIDRVRYGSPAHAAGVKDGDKIVELDGKPIRAQAQMRHVLGSKYAGDKVTLTVERGSERLTRELTLVDKLIAYESAFLGVSPVRHGAGEPPRTGITARYVYFDSPASRAGIERGNAIIKFGAEAVANADMLADRVSRIRPGETVKLTVAAAGQEREVEVVLGAMPSLVPVDIRPSPQPPREKELADATLKLGRFTEKSEAHDHEYWGFVPEDYNPEFEYSLLVWLHPPGDTMEAAMLKAWQTHCEEWGIILLAPKAKSLAGWIPDEAEFVKDLTEQFIAKYKIDRSRVALHTFGGTGMFAFGLGFKHRDLYRGLIVCSSSLPGPPPDNEPDFRQQFYLTSADNDPIHRLSLLTAKTLRDQKYPVIHTVISGGGHKYPGPATLLEMAIWLDSLDRI
ncbi:MAG: PDZ domain-containing protein, partial [Planctomycetaceae bacterium]